MATPNPRESNWDLWVLIMAPTIWALHLLLAYATASVWCAKVPAGSLATVRTAIGAYTLAALLAVGWIGRHGWQRHRFGDACLPHDFDSRQDRDRFLGFATFLLAGLSAVAIIYAALAALFFGDCR